MLSFWLSLQFSCKVIFILFHLSSFDWPAAEHDFLTKPRHREALVSWRHSRGTSTELHCCLLTLLIIKTQVMCQVSRSLSGWAFIWFTCWRCCWCKDCQNILVRVKVVDLCVKICAKYQKPIYLLLLFNNTDAFMNAKAGEGASSTLVDLLRSLRISLQCNLLILY